MDTTRQTICIKELKELKRDAQEMQKKGLPSFLSIILS